MLWKLQIPVSIADIGVNQVFEPLLIVFSSILNKEYTEGCKSYGSIRCQIPRNFLDVKWKALQVQNFKAMFYVSINISFGCENVAELVSIS